MAICTICKKTSEETTLYPGIQETEMINVCEECAEDQNIPIIKKPSDSQLSQADISYSVRERLDRMSGRHETTEISKDQTITQGNLSKLKMPKPKQYHPDILDNYYWTLNITRRRVKMTTSQLAKKIDTTPESIQQIEKGILPENFKEIFLKIEALLGIKLLKDHETQVNFTRKNRDEEKEILQSVAEKIRNPEKELEKDETMEEMEEIHKKIEQEEIKLSRKKDIKNVTLNDLVDRKRAREKYKMKVKQDEMMGDDIDIEEL
jgi:ribosome-binding protein aMBF1 (putative translation factor)